MKLFNYLILVMLLISSCKEDEVPAPVLNENYGEGMYIVTDMGISFYNYKDSLSQVEDHIFKTVNNTSIINPKSIRINGNKGYVVANKLYVVDINTFSLEAEVSGFHNAAQCDIVSYNRALVLDKGESAVKVVDLEKLEITSKIETGDSTKPVFIISNSSAAFVLNGGGIPENKKDSTVIVIKHRNILEPSTEISNVLSIGDNPNSAVIPLHLNVLCKGVYNPSNMINNSESSFHVINQYSHVIYSSNILSGIYNAQNLIENWNGSKYYFTAIGGIFRLNPDTYNTNLVLNINSDVIKIVVEEYEYADTDTTTAIGYYEKLYMNDLDSPNKIYKYNLGLSIFEDTLEVDGAVLDIQFKN
ncbi:hypothetical protein OAJ65_01360 [Flavobacteriales bacterium]|nr:hypothetical protein [Flavobacteriales bacterium]